MPSRRKPVTPTGAPALPTTQELTLYPSRKKWGLVLFGSLVFCAMTPFSLEKRPFVGWFGLALFGFCAVISLLFLLFPSISCLQLSADGFSVRSLFRRHFTRWRDVSNFGVADISMNPMVVYNYAPTYTGHKLGRMVAVDLSGWEAALPDTYGMDAQALADLLSEWKRRSEFEQSTPE